MIEIAALRQHLSLETRSLTEIASGLTVAAVVGATFYNIGFFTPIEWSLISVLSVQDLLIGSSIALLPMAFAAWLALVFGKFIANAPLQKLRTTLIALPLVVIGLAGGWLFLYGAVHSTIGHLGFSYLLTAGLAAFTNFYFKSRKVAFLWLGFSLVYVPFSVGISESLATIADQSSAQTDIRTSGNVMTGRILRVTSSYAILYDGSAVNVIPLNRIRLMRRVYAKSPELDYLANMTPLNNGR